MVADHRPLVREGLKLIIESEPDIEVVSLMNDGAHILKQVEKMQPHIVLLSLDASMQDSLACMRKLKASFSNLYVLVIRHNKKDSCILEALRHGADGFITKEMTHNELLEILRQAEKRLFKLSLYKLEAKHDVFNGNYHSTKHPTSLVKTLSKREHEMASFIIDGYTNKDMAHALSLSEGTIKNYIGQLYRKLGVHNRRQARAFLYRYYVD